MQRFIYTLIFLIFFLFSVSAYIFFFVPPDNAYIIMFFLGSLHLFISISLSLIIFLIFSMSKGKRSNIIDKANRMYKMTFVRVFLFFAPVAGIFTLKAFKLATNVNIFLILIVVAVLYILTEIKNRLPHSRIL